MSLMRAITAKYVFDGMNLLENKIVLIDRRSIIEVVDCNKPYGNVTLENYGNSIISPGLIDLQINGCGGVNFNDAISCDSLETMHQTNLRFGTRSYLPTLITTDFEQCITALEVVKKWFKRYANLRGVSGLHLEGPFIAKEKHGIHPQELIITPTTEMLKQIASYGQLFPVKLTLAPECVSLAQIKYLSQNGVIVALGHSNASFEVATAALNHGAKTVTHIFNAMSGMTGRQPGLIAAALANPCYAGIIADLIHVDKANIALVAKLKPDHTYLVTDAVAPTGTTMTEFDFAGKHLYVENGKCVDSSGTLGGAYLTLNQAVRNCITQCNIGIKEALRMATLIPARVIGIDNQFGQIKAGFSNQLIAINTDSYSCQLI